MRGGDDNMRIDALKYRTEDNQDIIIVVELMIGYVYQDKKIWRVADIGYKSSRKRKYTYLSTEIRDKYEYRKLSQEERESYIKEKYVEFVGVDKIEEAVIAAWKSIMPNTEELSYSV